MLLCFSSMSALEPRCWKAEALNAAADSLDSASWSARSPAEVSWLAAEAWWRADFSLILATYLASGVQVLLVAHNHGRVRFFWPASW